MDETPNRQPDARQPLVERLRDRALPLGLGICAVAAVAFAGNAAPTVAAAAVVVLLAVAMLAPAGHGGGGSRASVAGDDPAGRLTALSLAAVVPEPIVVFDARAELVHANPAARGAFSGLVEGVDLILRFRAPEMQELVKAALEGKATAPIDYSERLPLERLFRVSAAPVGDDGDLFVLVFRDQSEARRIDRMRADFIANASHELRTPLASIAGFVETLRGPARDDPKARDRFLGIMQAQTARMARLIDDLLSLSRLEMKPLAGSGSRVELRELAGSVADALSHLAQDAGVVVERRFPVGPVTVPGSRDELTQVFENLLENAIKYGQSGGRVVIAIETPNVEEATVAFQDFGPGIAEEHLPRVTERFYRVDVESSRVQKGTGLGLAIVKHILTRHNGRLSIGSKPGAGATFTVHLPTH